MTKGVSKLARLHPAPEELAEIIRLANLVPPDEPLKDLSEYIRGHLTDEDQHADEVHAALEKQFSRPRMENLARYIWTKPVPKVQLLGPDLPASRKQKTEFGYTFYLREWSSAFVGVPRRKSRSKLRRIFEKELPNSSPASVKEKTELGYVLYLRDALNEYEFVRQSRDNLRRLIVCLESSSDPDPEPGVLYDVFEMPTTLKIMLSAKGIIKTWNDRFAEAIVGVDAKRIKECEYCYRIFWAGRENATCCSTSCHANIRSQIARYLRANGFPAGVKLTEKEDEKKRMLISAWRKQRKRRYL